MIITDLRTDYGYRIRIESLNELPQGVIGSALEAADDHFINHHFVNSTKSFGPIAWTYRNDEAAQLLQYDDIKPHVTFLNIWFDQGLLPEGFDLEAKQKAVRSKYLGLTNDN